MSENKQLFCVESIKIVIFCKIREKMLTFQMSVRCRTGG